jgi:hypothetical protein
MLQCGLFRSNFSLAMVHITYVLRSGWGQTAGRIVGNDRIFKSEKQILCSCEEKSYSTGRVKRMNHRRLAAWID